MRIPVAFASLRHTGHSCNAVPLGLATVAAWVVAHLGDQVTASLFAEPGSLANEVEKGPPALACFSNYIWNAELSYQFARRLKQRHPATVIIFGGPNFPVELDEQKGFLEARPEIDFYIERAGEEPTVALMRALMAHNLNAEELKQSRGLLANCHYLVNGEHIHGELLPPLENLDDIPSPYLTGLCDRFLASGMVPVVQTTRGCPFRCQYCHEGNDYFCKLGRFSPARLRQELEYIAPRTSAPNLLSADSNFGMFAEDLAACQELAAVQEKHQWPSFFLAIEAKGKRERVLASLKLVRGAVLSAPVQSTDPTVLKNTDRRNVPWERMIEIVKSPEAMNASTISEVILCLPGDTKAAHTKSMTDLIDAEIDAVRSHQFMMLPGTKTSSQQCRQQHGMTTRFRMLPETGSTYELFSESFTAPEIDEICVANNTMSFEDYNDCRLFDLTVEIFYNDKVFTELNEMLKRHNVALSTFVCRVHQRARAADSPLAGIYEAFLRETRALWKTREELAALLRAPGTVARMQGGEIGINEQTTYHAVATVSHMRELHEVAFTDARDLLAAQAAAGEEDWQYLDELSEYSLLRKENLLDTAMDDTRRFTFNFPELEAAHFRVPPSSCRCPDGIEMRFRHTDEQRDLVARYVKLFGLSHHGLGSLISSASHVSKLFRQAVRVQP